MKNFLRLLIVALCAAVLSSCSAVPPAPQGGRMPLVRLTLLPPGVHGRDVSRTMTPRYITIHATENPDSTAARHALYLSNKGKRSGSRGRSGWVTWHFTVDDREIVEHLLPTEQGDHADFGGPGDRQSIGIEICEFSDPHRQAAAIDRAARLAAGLAERFNIPDSRIVPHKHWPRHGFPHGKPCPKILLARDSSAPGGWRLGTKWQKFISLVDRYR